MELKVVIHFKEGHRGLVAVQGKDTDPVMESFDLVGDEVEVWLAGAFAAVPDLLRRARERWASSPRNPVYQRPPVPPPAPTPPRVTPAPRPARQQPQRVPQITSYTFYLYFYGYSLFGVGNVGGGAASTLLIV